MDEPVEYRIGGGRWYFYGRQNGLDEPFPPAPAPAPTTAGDDAVDPLDEALRIVSTAWENDDSDGVVTS